MRVFINREFIVQVMCKRNMTNRVLSERIGVNEEYLSRLMNQRRAVSARMREKLIQAFRPHRWDDLFRIDEDDDTATPADGF